MAIGLAIAALLPTLIAYKQVEAVSYKTIMSPKIHTTNGIARIELLTHSDIKPTHAIIWLHGLGASADDFVPIVPHLQLDTSVSIKFVFPQAPDRAITINGGMHMPGWYDIKGLSIEDKQDEQGIAESAAIVSTLIDELIEQGIPANKIVLAGFSQGGAVVYHQSLRHPQQLAGLIALSTYLPFAEQVESQASEENKEIPILVQHGQFDPVVPIAMGEASAQRLQGLGYTLEWQVYPMEHEVIMEQIQELGRWINTILAKQDIEL